VGGDAGQAAPIPQSARDPELREAYVTALLATLFGGKAMIKILQEGVDQTLEHGRESYVTVKFTGYHETFKDIEIIRTFRLPPSRLRQEILEEEYSRWLGSYDSLAEF